VSRGEGALGRARALVREAFASTKAAPVVSIATIVMVAGMCATVLLTTGRTVGAEQVVLGSIDSAGTRAIIVRADSDAGLDSTVLERLANIDGIQWVAGFGQASDVTNAAISGATKVPARLAYGSHLEALGIDIDRAIPGRTAWASDTALTQLGMPEGVGAITNSEGLDVAVAGTMQVPDWLVFLEPVVLVPQPEDSQPAPVGVLVVIADRPELVAVVAETVRSVLDVDDPSKVTVTTSEALAKLRAIIQGQLGSFGRGLVLLILGISSLLVGVILTAFVSLRRKDFGRRRALGASRGLIVGLLLTQTLVLAAIGSVIGTLAAVAVLTATGDPYPSVAFMGAIAVLGNLASLLAAFIPAILAARRDPIRELRVP
jgi:putative ABC transport system permease protein